MPDARTAGRFGRLSWLWLTLLVLVIDQASKVYFDSALQMYQQVVIIPDYFSWTLAYNTGAAFSFLADSAGWQRWLFALIAVVVSAVLVVWLKRLGRDDTWLAIALALILGGALGNLYDRIAYGHVIDFIYTPWMMPAIYNVADMFIVTMMIGVALLVLRGRRLDGSRDGADAPAVDSADAPTAVEDADVSAAAESPRETRDDA